MLTSFTYLKLESIFSWLSAFHMIIYSPTIIIVIITSSEWIDRVSRFIHHFSETESTGFFMNFYFTKLSFHNIFPFYFRAFVSQKIFFLRREILFHPFIHSIRLLPFTFRYYENIADLFTFFSHMKLFFLFVCLISIPHMCEFFSSHY
jgi:hypothetical protein